MSSPRRRVGLLTGTFDPVHLGHVALAQAAMAACELDEVWFLVNPAPGHKQGVSALPDCVAMVRLAVSGVPGLREGEPEPPAGDPVRHTMADFELLMGRYPELEFVYIVGSDVLAGMADWEDYQSVLKRAAFAVARRTGAPGARLDSRLQTQLFDFADHTNASSSKIQEQLRAGKRPDELDDRVYEYIRGRGLYL